MRKLTLIILTILFSSILYAQNGKLVGVVKDKQTNEPLIGANVIINGTNYGAATDIDGKFIILNIPPGRYDVTASMVGYSKVTQTDVTLFIDRTTNIEFTLTDETIEIGQVTVTAAKPAVVKDRTSTATNIEAEQIKAAPIEGLRGTLDLSAGFQKNATGNYSVRGSGSYEVSFQINGLVQSNSNTSAPGSFDTEKADNSWKYDVNPLGVQQVQLITGGFSAEYGNAQAGVVNVVLKEGGPKFNGEFRVEYRPPGQYHYGDYIYSKNNYEWQKWGELADWMARRDDIIKELKLDVRYAGIKNSNPQLYDELVNREIAWAHSVWVENHEPSDDNVLGVYDYTQYAYTRYLFGFGGPLGKDPNFLKFYLSGEYKRNPTRLPTPEKVQELQNYILNVTYNPIKDHKIRLMGSYQSYTGGLWSGSDDIRWSGLAFTPPGVSTKYLVTVDPVREEQTIAQSLEWVYTINNNSFFQLNLSHQQEQYEIPFKYLAGYGLEVDRVDSSSDPTGTVLREGSWWEKDFFRAPFGFSTNYYQDSRTENFGIKGDYTNQISNSHLVKAGFQFYYWDLFNNGVNSSFQANSYVARNGFADFYQAYPINYSFYVQDKMEYEGMIANVGMRVEAYNFQTGVPLDRFNILYPGTEGPGTLGSPLTENSDWKYILLPRLGISFPIGESTAFRFQYGHFASMPIFSQALSKKTWVGWQGLGNPNLDPKKTINYEFGLQQQVDDNHRLDMVLYYNDRTTQIGRQNIASFTGSRNQFAGFASDNSPLYYYWSFANNSFGSTVGLELTFETIRIQNWSYRFSYSLSQTTSGNYGASIVYPDDSRGYSTRDYTGEFLAPWDRTHNFRALVQYFFREDEGFSIFGVNPLENLIVSMTYTAQSGTPFTYVTDFTLRDVVYNRRYPIESTVDLNLTKEIMLSDIKLILGLRVMNLFDNKWITPMSTSDDVRLWVEDGITIADAGIAERGDPSRLSYITAPYRIYRNIPRQIFFTLGIGF
jgi:hypothetical protein